MSPAISDITWSSSIAVPDRAAAEAVASEGVAVAMARAYDGGAEARLSAPA